MLKIRLGARRASSWRGPELSWPALGRYLAGFWALLDGSWPLWDASWAPLGHSLGALGWSSVLLGRILPPLEPPEPRFWRVWGRAGLGSGRLRRHVLACLSLRLAFRNILEAAGSL